MLLHAVIPGSACRVWRTKSMFSWSSTKSSISVKTVATCQVFVDVPHYCASSWGPIVWKMLSQLTDSSFKINTSKVVNYHVYIHPLKTVAYFQPSLLKKKWLPYSSANEQVGKLKQMIIINNQKSSTNTIDTAIIGYVIHSVIQNSNGY